MMNNTTCYIPHASPRELRFGSWTVSIARSPQRIRERLTDFSAGMRWGALGLFAAMVAIAANSL